MQAVVVRCLCLAKLEKRAEKLDASLGAELSRRL